jgi:hypothetical protein
LNHLCPRFPFFFLGREEGVWTAHRQCSTLARSSCLQLRILFIIPQRAFLQPRVFFLQCVDWQLASAWNVDARSVRAPSRSPAESHSFLGLGVIPDSHRTVSDARAFDIYIYIYILDALRSCVVPGPEPNAGAYKKSPLLPVDAILGHAESDAGHRNACALRVRGMYMRSGPCIGIGIGREIPIPTPIRVSVLPFTREASCLPCIHVWPRLKNVEFPDKKQKALITPNGLDPALTNVLGQFYTYSCTGRDANCPSHFPTHTLLPVKFHV